MKELSVGKRRKKIRVQITIDEVGWEWYGLPYLGGQKLNLGVATDVEGFPNYSI